jgi:bifunctional non-homologous end joining protein LigD
VLAFPAFRRYGREVLSQPPVPAFPAGFIEPCLPTGARSAPSGPLWVHEIKFDGYRFICRREGERVRVFSRHGRDWTDRVPLIAEALLALRAKSVTLDGEGVVCDELGVSDFERLRSALARRGSRVTLLYAFDLLELDGQEPADASLG